MNVQQIADEQAARWIVEALHTIRRGVCDKLTKNNITVYRVKNIIRIDIEDTEK